MCNCGQIVATAWPPARLQIPGPVCPTCAAAGETELRWVTSWRAASAPANDYPCEHEVIGQWNADGTVHYGPVQGHGSDLRP